MTIQRQQTGKPTSIDRVGFCHPKGRGFTLIELLVVVSIITLLISILLPSLGKARTQAGSTVCLTKVHALLIATTGYINEYDGSFPINGLILPKSSVPAVYRTNPVFASAVENNVQKWRPEFGALWTYMGGRSPNQIPTAANPLPIATPNLMKGYLCEEDVKYGCNRTYSNTSTGNSPLTMQPLAANPSLGLVTMGPGSPGYWSYSVNAVTNSLGRFRDYAAFSKGLPWTDPVRTINIRTPSQFLIFIEEKNSSPFNDEVFDSPAYNGGDQLTDRHANKGSVGYADGHADLVDSVMFNNQPAASDGTNISNAVAMQSPVTREFFPDYGAFAGSE